MNAHLPFIRSFLTCVLVLSTLHVVAQNIPGETEQRRYRAAVRMVQIGDYERAKSELIQIAQRGGSLAPFAQYYYAVAAFRQKNFTSARLWLRQLLERYPDWNKRDEAEYLFASTAMETGQYEDALAAIQHINDPTVKASVDKLERYFLSRLTDLSRLKTMQAEFPDNRNLALILIDRIQKSSSDKNDLELSDRLTNRFGVAPVILKNDDSPILSTTAQPTPTGARHIKGFYNVAVLFPFKLDEFDPGQRVRQNQYIFDLVEGMKLAKNKLQAEGITVNLLPYDLENDADKTLDLLNNPGFAQNDILVGPLYAEPNRLATDYANQNGMWLVNPIATNADLIQNQPLSFLAQPSVVQQAEKTATFARSLGGDKKAAVYFGASRKDSLLAVAYQAELMSQGFNVIDFRRLAGKADAMAAAMKIGSSALTASTTIVATPAPSVGMPGHVFFASSSTDDGPRLLEALSRRKVGSPLVATSTAFDQYKHAASVFSRRELYLLAPDYMDTTRQPVSDFQEDYLGKWHIIPSIFAAQGYDMMLFFGRALAKNDSQLRNRNTLKPSTDDYVLSGFDYSKSNDNQIVPILKYEGGRFVKIN